MLLASSRGAAVEQIIGDAEIAAPDLCNAEVVHAFRRMEAAGLVGGERATAAIALLVDAPIERLATSHLVGAIWALRHNLSPYDATYVALARGLDCPLVTTDARLARAPGNEIEIIAI